MHIHTRARARTQAHILKQFGFILVIVYRIKKNHFILLSTHGELLSIQNSFFLNPRKDNQWEVAKTSSMPKFMCGINIYHIVQTHTVIHKCPLLKRRKRNKNCLKMMKLINLVISFTLVVGNRNI